MSKQILSNSQTEEKLKEKSQSTKKKVLTGTLFVFGNDNTVDGVVSSPRHIDSINGRPVRIYLDGCWDVMHSGHYNAIRQAKLYSITKKKKIKIKGLGDILIVGVHSDKEIARNKREPVMNDEERMAMVRACKWTDEVVFDVPYSPTVELLDSSQVRADYVAHGDDIPHDATGQSAYAAVMNRLKIFKRTPGVSTTALIERLLLAVNHEKRNREPKKKKQKQAEEDDEANASVVSWSQFLATSHRISAFSNHRVPQADDVVVYIDGSWDLFHPGHVAALKKFLLKKFFFFFSPKKLCTFLYVGLYDDTTIREKQGKYWPMMSLQERTLNVLSCRYVDEVVIGCPWVVSRDMVNVLNIRVLGIAENVVLCPNDLQRYYGVKDLVKVEKLTDLESNLKTQDLVERILRDHNKYSKQNENRVQRELKYITEREYIEET
ncbi:hypothetical protein RFI_17648 [Reticulomyxa filosa]|uniref:ethanolamine-phosphate cytidylyltransferase n=1 Tax=Reticulomyxa filosa TaxID=46433 RepID=X6MZX9_RETFI|nr:hypothetical protein RFI_17648 [Reticulomyxa filosa]|eukprot:ETO19585.1 hypothetical protein RFI_17648 [Reticulomyxa filosa]